MLYACDVCDFSNHDRLVVVYHIETNHIEKKLTGRNDKRWTREWIATKCSKCDKKVKEHVDLVSHMTLEHKESIMASKQSSRCKESDVETIL